MKNVFAAALGIGIGMAFLPLAGCAGKTCAQRADEAYQLCQHPPHVSTDDRLEPVVGEDAQSCHESHRKQLEKCTADEKDSSPPVSALPGAADAG